LKIPAAITEQYGGKPTRPLDVARALGVQPSSGPFRMLCGSAIAYGLTDSGYNSSQIAVTPLGRRIFRPLSEGDDLSAKREASLKPNIIRMFLERYDGAKLPREDIGRNVLEQMSVPTEVSGRTFALIVESADAVGLLKAINGVQYVDLQGIHRPGTGASGDLASESSPNGEGVIPNGYTGSVRGGLGPTNNRVFIAHGKNDSLVPQLKELLQFAQYEPIVSVERPSLSIPVTEKVMAEMRSCSAAIIHVDKEREVITAEGEQEIILNNTVLIEIGAAYALYGRRFILLVGAGVRLPSNLQGLYEVRYSGDRLDGDATLRVLKVMHELRKSE